MSASVTAQPRSVVGQQIGEYLVRELVGVGGMGQVYEGTQPLIGKRVAIKVLAAERCVDLEAVARFVAEARAVNSIRHRNIVDVFSFGQLPDGSHYLVMEFLEGEPFDRLIANRAPLDPAEALIYVEEILEALAAAHGAGIVHRDIKPSNLFLVRQRRGRPYVKLLDFGAAKLGAAPSGLTRASPASLVIGTPSYMPPEQALGLPVGPASDLYAVGAVLFELLTGQQPFPSVNPFECMQRHVQEPAAPPSRAVPTLPAALDELVLALLRKEPGERPQSADSVRKWCEAIRAALPQSAPQAPAAGGSAPLSVPVISFKTMPRAAAPLPPVPPDAGRPLVAHAGRGQLVVLGGGVALMLLLGAAALWPGGSASGPLVVPPPSETVQVRTLRPPEAAIQSLPEPEAPAAPTPAPPLPAIAAAPAPKPVAAAVRARPRSAAASAAGALTDAALMERKAQLEARLSAREAAVGEPDRIVRRLLEGVDLASARDEGARRQAWNRLEEIGRQLDGR